MTVSFMCNVISSMGTLLASFYICERSLNQDSRTSQKALMGLWCIMWALLEATAPHWLLSGMSEMLYCAASSAMIWVIYKQKLDATVSAFLFSYGMGFILYAAGWLPVSLAFAPFLGMREYTEENPIDFNEPIYLLFYALIAALQLFLSYRFFKIRRFKRGFSFLFARYTVAVTLIIAGLFFAFNTLIIDLWGTYGGYQSGIPLITSTGITGAGIYVWIRRSMKMWQRKRAWERNEEIYHKELAKVTQELERYKEMHESVRVANHRVMHRLSAAEESILMLAEEARSYGLPPDICDKITERLKDVCDDSEGYKAFVGGKEAAKLSSTNIQSMDGLFRHFAWEFYKSNIDFNLMISGSIVHMVETVIKKGKLETMIGDHLQDALIAVNASDNAAGRVLAMIGEADGCYEFSVQDNGIPFEVDTLIKLGAERVTTHQENGGSGIGFMTTFETMKECGASLIIHENPPGSSYSKTVTIRFDGENRYVIETYRPDDFPHSDRVSVTRG